MTDESRMTRRGPDARQWYVVATAGGETEAAIIAGLLESNDIPVWIYRESAGRALGLNVGILGTTEILTPDEYYDDALDLLSADDDEDLLEDGVDPLDDELTIDGATAPPEDDRP